MNRFRILTITALLTGVLTVGVVQAQGPGGRRGFGGPFGPGGVGVPLRGLNLSDAQETQIRTLTQQYREQNRAAAERLRTAFEAQRKAVEAIPMNEQLIRSTTQELAEAQTDMAIQRARMNSEIFALLTPEQQAQAKKLQAEREARAKQRLERRQQNQQNRRR